jgi:hypothetical protein
MDKLEKSLTELKDKFLDEKGAEGGSLVGFKVYDFPTVEEFKSGFPG